MKTAKTPSTPEEWRDDLLRLGWTTWKKNPFLWQSPDGRLYRGPYRAWTVATGTPYGKP